MNRWKLTCMMLLATGLMISGCSQNDPVVPQDAPEQGVMSLQRVGTEALGEISVADGSGFAEGGVGMVGVATGTLDISVPAGATVEQVLLYWVGGTTADVGDDTIEVDGNSVTGMQIGGPTNFFENMNFFAYRADVTAQGWVAPGDNSFEISGFDFDFTGNTHDENNGAGMIVVYDDGSTADLQFFDGLDMAFFRFASPLDATVPITFDFAAESVERTAQFIVQAGSVGENRPNRIVVTTSAGDQVFDDVLGSVDGLLFDSIALDVTIPAGATQLTAELISVPSDDPLGASMGWIGSGLSVPTTPEPPTYCIGDYVWYDADGDGCQDPDEMGAAGVEVNLYAGCDNEEVVATTFTDENGYYEFCELMPGDYRVRFAAPAGYEFCEQYAEACGPEADSDADANGLSGCVTIVDQDDRTIDAGLCPIPQEEGCTRTIGYWMNHLEVAEPLLPIWLGDADGDKSLLVDSTALASDILHRALADENGRISRNNMIIKLYAQLLATKLSIANGATPDAVADAIAEADAYLADHDWLDWNDVRRDDKDMLEEWKDLFDAFNMGDIGPGHCD